MQTVSFTPIATENLQDIILSEQDRRRARAETIIIDGAFTAGWASFVFIPFVDGLFVAAVQLKMINELCVEYNVKFTEHLSRTLLVSLLSAVITDAAEKVILSFVKMTPAGMALKVGGMYLVGGALTYAIGKVFMRHLENNGSLENLKLDETTQTYFTQMYEEGKGVVKWA